MKNASLYETHIKTKNLRKAIAFYQALQLELAYMIPERGVAFFWLGDPARKEQMIGIWEVSEASFQPAHFAFSVSLPELLKIPNFLAKRNISLRPGFGLDTSEPIVHTWMPAAAYYFSDEDGNSVEYLAILDQEPNPDLPAMHLSEWLKLSDKSKKDQYSF